MRKYSRDFALALGTPAPAPPIRIDPQTAAFQSSVQQLDAAWEPLPLAPYPPGGDTTGFPQQPTTVPAISVTSINTQQKLEPEAVVQNVYDQAVARRPKFNALFVIGLGLVGYWAWKLR